MDLGFILPVANSVKSSEQVVVEGSTLVRIGYRYRDVIHVSNEAVAPLRYSQVFI